LTPGPVGRSSCGRAVERVRATWLGTPRASPDGIAVRRRGSAGGGIVGELSVSV
jgi:hypothetical protein